MKIKSIIISIISIVAIFCIYSFATTGADDPKALAKVTIINGKYIFVQCEPVQPYELAFQYKTVVGGFSCPSILDIAEGSLKKAEKKGLPFDGIILGNTKDDIAIKFK